MEFYNDVYRRYYEEYESVGIHMHAPSNIGLIQQSAIIEWMDRPDNVERSRKRRGLSP